MKRIINCIVRNKIQIILVMGLSIISFFLCLVALTNSFVFKAQIRDLKKMFQADMEKIAVLDFSYVKDFDNFGYDIDEIKNNIRKDYGLICGAYAESYIVFEELWNEESYIECNREKYKGTFHEEDPELSDVILVDPDIMNIVDCGIEKDMLLPITIDKELYYPIYVGIDYKNVIEVGDVLTDTTFDTRYIVMGYIEDANWFDYSDPFEFPVASMEHKFLASFSKEEQTDAMTQMSTVSQIFIKIDYDQGEFINQILEQASKKDIKLHISSVENKIQELQADNHETLQNEYSFTVTIMICSMISISSIFCAFILMQKKEYGIRLAFGETKEKLICLFAGRHLLIVIFAMMVAIWLVKKYLGVIVMETFVQLFKKTLVEYAIPITILVSVLYTLISLIPPMIMLNRLELVQLTKEEGI